MLALKEKISEKPRHCYLESENPCEKELLCKEGLASPQLLCKEARFEHRNSISKWCTVYHRANYEHPRKLLKQAHVQCTINLTIVTKFSLGTEHLLAKNMLPLGNEHNIRFSISYKNSRKKGRERFSMFYCVFNGKSLR